MNVLTRKPSQRSTSKTLSKASSIKQKPISDHKYSSLSPQLKKRESKRLSKSDQENTAMLLEIYNDLKSLHESRDLPNRQVYLRRIGLNLVKHRSELYKFPVLQYIEETSKIMLMNEFELLYWYHLMKTYLKHIRVGTSFSKDSVKLFFFQSGMFVKRFLYFQQQNKEYKSHILEKFSRQIEAIEAYIKTYHYSNFDQVYKLFDRADMILLDPDFYESGIDQIRKQFGNYYESFSYLSKLSLAKLQKIFEKLKKPFQTDEKRNIIDYNWHVDGILKNSQSYNKDPFEKKDTSSPKKVSIDDQLPVQSLIKGHQIEGAQLSQILTPLQVSKGGNNKRQKRDRVLSNSINQQSTANVTPQLNPSINNWSFQNEPINSFKPSEMPFNQFNQNFVKAPQQQYAGTNNEALFGSPNFVSLYSLINPTNPEAYQSNKELNLTPQAQANTGIGAVPQQDFKNLFNQNNNLYYMNRQQSQQQQPDDNYSNYQISPSNRYFFKKPFQVVPQMTNIQPQVAAPVNDLQRHQSGGFYNIFHNDQTETKPPQQPKFSLSELDFKTIQQNLGYDPSTEYGGNENNDPSPSLDELNRKTSASQFLLSSGQQYANLNKNNSIISLANMNMHASPQRENSGGQTLERVKSELPPKNNELSTQHQSQSPSYEANLIKKEEDSKQASELPHSSVKSKDE